MSGASSATPIPIPPHPIPDWRREIRKAELRITWRSRWRRRRNIDKQRKVHKSSLWLCRSKTPLSIEKHSASCVIAFLFLFVFKTGLFSSHSCSHLLRIVRRRNISLPWRWRSRGVQWPGLQGFITELMSLHSIVDGRLSASQLGNWVLHIAHWGATHGLGVL